MKQKPGSYPHLFPRQFNRKCVDPLQLIDDLIADIKDLFMHVLLWRVQYAFELRNHIPHVPKAAVDRLRPRMDVQALLEREPQSSVVLRSPAPPYVSGSHDGPCALQVRTSD